MSQASASADQRPSAKFVASTGKLSKLVGKKASRAKELLLQNFTRTDKTTDELFHVYETNFYKQQAQAQKLSKEFRNYANSLKSK